MNDILKIKIVRDFNKIRKNVKNAVSTNGIANSTLNINKLKSKYPEKYIKLLDLIETTWYQENYAFQLKISDINKMDLDLFEKVINLNNVKIVKSPLFTIYYIENNELKTYTKNVGSFKINSYNFIIEHQNHIFHIYTIEENYVRWYQEECNIEYLKKLRKEKLEKLNSI